MSKIVVFKEHPYFKTDKDIVDYYGRIARSVDTTLMRDLPAAEKIEYETLGKLRKLLITLIFAIVVSVYAINAQTNAKILI